jgi:hypothetical protein
MNPVIDERAPGLKAMFPITLEFPVLVIVEPAKTVKLPAAPRLTAAGLAAIAIDPLRKKGMKNGRTPTLVYFFIE